MWINFSKDSGGNLLNLSTVCVLSVVTGVTKTMTSHSSLSEQIKSQSYSIEMHRGYHTIIYHQFVSMRVREEPHWQGASNHNAPLVS